MVRYMGMEDLIRLTDGVGMVILCEELRHMEKDIHLGMVKINSEMECLCKILALVVITSVTMEVETLTA